MNNISTISPEFEKSTENKKINTNSYADNFDRLVKNVNSTLQGLDALNQLATTDATHVVANIDSEEGTKTITLPSYQTVLNKLKSVESGFESLVTGYGNVKTTDGTDRILSVSPIPTAPDQIFDLEKPTTFHINNNWFFEDLIFPRLQVKFDLTNKIESSSDRVRISRIILDLKSSDARNFYNNEILKNSIESVGYERLKTLLSENNIKYFEDEQDVQLPLVQERYTGSFSIVDVRQINGQTWYYLSTLNYSTTTDKEHYDNLVLQASKDDSKPTLIKYRETLYRVDEVFVPDMRIRVTPYIGADVPGLEDIFTIYNEPFQLKEVSVNIGFNEIDFVFFKAVNEQYNIISNDWSPGVHFVTNELVYDSDKNEQLTSFYYKFVADFGSKWISELKDKKVYAFNGIIPNRPIIKSDYFSVVQINTQLNAALSTADIKATTANVESLKSTITSLKETIGLLKIDLQNARDTQKHSQIQNQININTTKLNHTEAEYRTSLKYLQDLAKGSGLLDVKPKYRIRGFFPIPESQFADNEASVLTEQKIIGFEVLYRYLKLDNTGTELKTFTYNNDNIDNIGVYSDWQQYTTGFLQKVWDPDLECFVWKEESISDGKVRNINQLDIPIQRGENVEIKIRSISEAGYPENPLKSDWSDPVIVEFPTELSTESEIATLLRDSLDEQTDIQIDTALKSLGVYSHVNDQSRNLNAGDDTLFYKHKAQNISIEYIDKSGKVFTVPLSILIDGILAALFDMTEGDADKIKESPKRRQDVIDSVLQLKGYLKTN